MASVPGLSKEEVTPDVGKSYFTFNLLENYLVLPYYLSQNTFKV